MEPLFKRILVPLDGSELSQFGLLIAARLAESLKSALILCHVIDGSVIGASAGSGISPNEVRQSLQIEGNELLRDGARTVAVAAPDVTTVIEEGRPAQAILEIAAQ